MHQCKDYHLQYLPIVLGIVSIISIFTGAGCFLGVALAVLGIKTPDEFEFEGKTYVRAENGYIVKGMENDKDVKRGLYMLSLPMTFTFKINITELAHVYIERGKSKKNGGLAHGTAAPELQIAMEDLIDQIEEWYPGITREFLLEVENNNV